MSPSPTILLRHCGASVKDILDTALVLFEGTERRQEALYPCEMRNGFSNFAFNSMPSAVSAPETQSDRVNASSFWCDVSFLIEVASASGFIFRTSWPDSKLRMYSCATFKLISTLETLRTLLARSLQFIPSALLPRLR